MQWIRFLLCLTALCVCLRPVGAVAASMPSGDLAEIHLPFRYSPPLVPFIIVQASIDGHPPLPFLVDTGVSASLLIDTVAARKLQIHPNGQLARANGTLDLVGADVGTISVVGAASGEHLDCAPTSTFLIDLSLLDGTYAGPRIAGIIGAPLLSQFAVRLDFTRRLLTVYTSGTPPLPADRATVVPMKARDDGYNVIVSPQKSISVRVVVDTGALVSSLPVSVSGYLHPRATMMGHYRQLGFAIFGDRWRLPTYQIGEMLETDVAVSAAPSFTFAALGLDLLSRFRVTLDFPHERLILERDGGSILRRHLRGWAGIELESSGKGFRVAGVSADGRAGQTAPRRGTEITAIDGQPLVGLPLAVVDGLLNGAAGTQANLTLRRRGHLETVILNRACEFDAPPSLLVGTILRKPDGGPLAVLRVAEGTVADRAGLAANDEILVLNGASADGMTPEEAWQQVRAAKITLRVRRRGQPQPVVLTLNGSRSAHAH